MRFVSVGNVVVDVLTRVPALPERGGDVLGTASGMSPGGSFNAMVAASRQGLPAVYAGGHGTGFFGDLIRAFLRENRIEALLPPTPDADSGYDIALVDDAGERTFVTSFGAEAELTAAALDSLKLEPDDILHVSGYGLLERTNGAVLGPWLRELDPAVTVLLDPGPLVADIPPDVWAAVLGRANWLSCNEREAEVLSGESDPGTAISMLADRELDVIVRVGADGCIIASGCLVVELPGFLVDVVDTNGAGDAHIGAFAAGLAAGLDWLDAAARANACAALAVSRFGPATAPTLDEVLALIAEQG